MTRCFVFSLFAISLAAAQGEYLRHGESGFVISRVISESHAGQQRGISTGLSFYGRIDIAMAQDDRHTLFDDVNGYSATFHILKQTFDEQDVVPFSLALSISNTDADIRTYSVIPYAVIPLSRTVELIVHTGVSASRQVSSYSIYSEYLYSFPVGGSVMFSITDWTAVGLEAGAVFSKVYPGFGFGATFVVNYDHSSKEYYMSQ